MYKKPSLATFYRLRMLPLQKGNFAAHNHVSWLFGLEISIIEDEIRGNLRNLKQLEPPVDCKHDT